MRSTGLPDHVFLRNTDGDDSYVNAYGWQPCCAHCRVVRIRLLTSSEIQAPTIKLRILYCGGCNPEIDRGLLVERLKQLIESVGIKPVLCKDDQADWLILVNGCARACLEDQFPESQRGPWRISVQGANLDYRAVAENELPRAIWDEMRKLSSQGLSNE